MNNEVLMTEDKLKSAANKLRNYLSARGTNINEIECLDSHAKRLEALSQILFGRPYNEAKHTILSGVAEPTPVTVGETPEHKGVVLALAIGSNTILGQDGHYITATNPGTDMEIPWRSLHSQGFALAAATGSEFREFTLPDSMANCPVDSDDQFMMLAEQLGLFSQEPSLAWDLFSENQPARILVNGLMVQNLVGPDGIPRMLGSDSDVIAEHPMAFIKDPRFPGFWLTGEDLAGAEYVGNGNWKVRYDQFGNEPVTITILKD